MCVRVRINVKYHLWYLISDYVKGTSVFSQAVLTAVDLSGYCSTLHCLFLSDSFGSTVKALVCELVRTSVQSQ